MKPVRLVFKGLRSYRQQAEIDFTELDLFAIIGDTGAGKSSILEAITFALYAKKTWSGGSLNELIADGEKQLIVEFIFEADGDEWTVTRTRNRSSSPGINKLVNRSGAVKVDNNTPVNAKVEELLGLDCDQFMRAVLMPQGRFDELLRATPTERTKILTSILGLDELTTVRQRAERHRARWREPLTAARTERSLLPPDADAALEVAERDAAAAAERHVEITAATKAVGEAAARERALGAAVNSVADALSRVPALERADVVDRLAHLVEAGTQLESERGRRAAALRDLDADIAALEGDWNATLNGFDSRDAVVAARGDVHRAAKGLTEATRRLEVLRADRVETLAAAPPESVEGVLVDRVDRARAAVEVARAAAVDTKAALDDARRLSIVLVEARADHQVRVEETDRAGRELKDAQGALDAGTEAVERCRRRAEAATDALNGLLRSGAVAAIAAHVHPGDDCPVCERPLPATFEARAAPDYDAAQQEADTATSELDATTEAASSATAAVAVAERAQRDADERLANALAVVASAEDATRNAGLDVAAETPDVSAFERAVEAANRELTIATEQESRDAEELRAAEKKVAAAFASHTAAVAGVDQRIAEIETEVARHERAGASLPSGWRLDAPVTVAAVDALVTVFDAALEALDGLVSRRSRLDKERADHKEAVQAIDQRVLVEVDRPKDALVADVREYRARVADVVDDAQRLRDALGDEPRLAPTELPAEVTDATVPEALGAAAAVVEASTELRARGDAEHSRITAQIATQLARVGYESLRELDAAEGQARQLADDAAKAVDHAVRERDRVAELDAFLDIGEPFSANLDVLVESLRDSAFIKFLVAARESELLAEANRRLLAITKGKFGFVAGFGVANTASGETRTPEALSGGERFQAALALALGLVEIASRGRGRLDAVFVDEGFGSLDGASLNAALSTLGSVAGGGKTVALISHLRPVAEFVETVLMVTRDDVLGSRIDKLDPDERDRMLADDIRSGLTA
jgi:exonuclease SbcC